MVYIYTYIYVCVYTYIQTYTHTSVGAEEKQLFLISIGREENFCSQGITNTFLGLLSLSVFCDIINCDVLVLC